MTLSDILALPDGTKFGPTPLLVTECKTALTKAKKEFLNLTVCDQTGSNTSPLWDNVLEYREMLPPGTIAEITGVKSSYNDKAQLNFKGIHPAMPGLYAVGDFIPSYDIEHEKFEILHAIRTLPKPWCSILDYAFGLDDYLGVASQAGQWQRFIECPAAKTHHGNRVGGLVAHTCGVLRIVDAVIALYPTLASIADTDRLRFLAIFHDYGKMWEYTWATGIGYRDDALVDHRVTGPMFFEKFCDAVHADITWADKQKVMASLASHHGFYGEKQPVSPEDHLLFLADMMESKIQEAFDALAAMGVAAA